jgi:alkylation response protein AidB-like acyl-CoA dehydrogenase
MHYQVYSLAEELEAFMGDPYSKTTTFSYENCAALDIQEAFPHEIAANLEKWGLHKYYAPVEYGGVMESYEQALMLMRLVARRDLTVAIGHGKTYLGSVCVWIGASKEQACKLGEGVANGKIVSLALTERMHGSDIMANDFSAEFDGEGFLLNGEKWLINNATRGDALTVFVRTDPNGGARGYSVFLVEKDKISPETYQCLEKVKTHGIRGADISGIQFNNACISKDGLVGQLGYGLEIVLKALQITRTLCASLSLGAADNALRITYQFATQRQLYGKKLLEIPHTRQVLLEAYSDLLIAEVVSITSSRAIHVITDQMSLVSAITKYFVPSSTEMMIDKLATVLGARAYLLDVFEHGRFQKVERDHRIVGLFDGNTLVNLQVIINQLKSLCKGRHNKRVDSTAISKLFDLTAQLPAFVREKLSLSTRGQDAVVNSLPGALEKIDNYCQIHGESNNLPVIKGYVDRIIAELGKFDNEVLNTDWVINSIPTKCFTLAEKYSTFYAAAACIQFWLQNQRNIDDNSQIALWEDGLWLRVCLERLLSKLNIYVTTSDVAEAAFLQDLDLQYHKGLLFSLLPLKLSDARS